ncbi:MAG TPA: SDR family NAD(P)-dependent oxidoreductase [Candidatus Micrarchaeia archaeon]|nr:SDR family NAD(P)-dependent oxidoreductase [Candidatus Micrarchaeia archaeon]
MGVGGGAPAARQEVALVTGAGSPRGIGFASAARLAGWCRAVAVTATGPRIQLRADELSGRGAEVLAVTADLTDPAAAQLLVAAVLERFGRLDVVVANAGIAAEGEQPATAHFATMSAASFEHALAVNLATAVHTLRAALPPMLAAGYGRVVVVSSVTGPLVSTPGDAAYATAKAGLTGLVRTVALETAERGVTVNCVLPGWIATDSSTPSELRAGRHTPAGRPGTADEVAAAVEFLAGRAAAYVTGVGLVVDGGNTLQEDKGPPRAGG